MVFVVSRTYIEIALASLQTIGSADINTCGRWSADLCQSLLLLGQSDYPNFGQMAFFELQKLIDENRFTAISLLTNSGYGICCRGERSNYSRFNIWKHRWFAQVHACPSNFKKAGLKRFITMGIDICWQWWRAWSGGGVNFNMKKNWKGTMVTIMGCASLIKNKLNIHILLSILTNHK